MLLLYLSVCFFKLIFYWKYYNVSATWLKTLVGKKNLQRRLHFRINPFKAPTPFLTIILIILWDSLIFYQILLSPKMKRCTIITYRHGIYELPHELPKDLKLRILGNWEILAKCLHCIKWYSSAHSFCQNKNFVNTSKTLPKNGNKTFPVVCYFIWKLELVSDILWLIAACPDF